MMSVMPSPTRDVLFETMPSLSRTGDPIVDSVILQDAIRDPGRSGGPYDTMYGTSAQPLGPSYRAELAEMRVATRKREEALVREINEKYFVPIRRFGQRIVATVDPVYARQRYYSGEQIDPLPISLEISAKPLLRAITRIVATVNKQLDRFDDFVDDAFRELTDPAYREMNSRIRTVASTSNSDSPHANQRSLPGSSTLRAIKAR